MSAGLYNIRFKKARVLKAFFKTSGQKGLTEVVFPSLEFVMSYQAIYRKWRPITFEDVVGQSHITDTLKTEIKNNRIAHAYLFCGTRGTGKTTTAKILSRAVNCENPLPNGNPCNECASCRGILSNTVMDVAEIDAASNNGVDNIRELRDEISYTPANVKYKIYIIDEVHMLSTGAFNALLKTLEEPPSHAIFILATTEPHKIPATIQSRCQRFDFKRISAKDIAGRIGEITNKDGIKITQSAIRLVAELGDGSMRDALSILDLCNGIDGEITAEDIENVTGAVSRKSLVSLAKSLVGGDVEKSLVLIDGLLSSGREASALLDELVMCFREMLVCKLMENPSEITDRSDEEIQHYKEIVKSVPKESIIHIIKVLSETLGLCKTSTNPRAMIDSAAVKICDPSCDPSAEAFAARIAKLEALVTLGGFSAAVGSGEKRVGEVESVPLVSENDLQPTGDISQESEALPYSGEDDDEEYVCETEEYADDVPPFDVSEIPYEEPVSDIQNEGLKPHTEEFEKSEADFRAPSVEKTEREASSDNSSQSKENVGTLDTQAALEALMTVSPALGSILRQAKIKYKEDVCCVVFAEEVFKNTVSGNADFVKSIKNALKAEHLKIMTEKEFSGEKTEDPLDEIISKAEDFGQISIFSGGQ